MSKQIAVVAAVILRDGLVLCAQRAGTGPLAGLWEFPGGKIEPAESPRTALVREIHEELGCVVDVGDEVTTTRHEYSFAVVTLTTFTCQLVSGTPQAIEHAQLRWLAADDLSTLDWAPADVPAMRLVSAREA